MGGNRHGLTFVRKINRRKEIYIAYGADRNQKMRD